MFHGLPALPSKMNSLNIITARVSPSSSPSPSPEPPPSPSPSQPRPHGTGAAITSIGSALSSDDRSQEQTDEGARQVEQADNGPLDDPTDEAPPSGQDEKMAAEERPLLDVNGSKAGGGNCRASWWHALPRDLASSIVSSIRWVFATLASPGVYLMAYLYDEHGNFAPMSQLKRLFGVRKTRRLDDYAASEPMSSRPSYRSSSLAPPRPALPSPTPSSSTSTGSSSSGASSDSEAEKSRGSAKNWQGRSKSLSTAEQVGSAQRSIRIKLHHNDDALGQRKHKRAQSAAAARDKASQEDLSAQLKSPTSPIAALTRYPKTPAPPRPLIPRRQPSYLNFNMEAPLKQQKTLVLDLDETLIHSMSKGGRMSTGHMVEVRLNAASLGMGGGGGGSHQNAAMQHPILYWVNKRPYCDEFLRRVCKWFNLVIFTASVQEYADPVIDWLESERKFFSARYYRQHCTYRQGAYIKDLSSVEPDLSKVLILDNSPLSYMFHEDNAIPIQGWINDPTDNDLMHLVPLLEGLQYVHDVRALLALRGGEVTT